MIDILLGLAEHKKAPDGCPGQSHTLNKEHSIMSEQQYTLPEVDFSSSDNSKPAGFNRLSQQWETEINQDQAGGAK